MRLMPIYQKPDTSRPTMGHKAYPDLFGGLRVVRANQFWCAGITGLHACETGSQARAGIGRWTTFCNHHRPHTAHGGQPPAVADLNRSAGSGSSLNQPETCPGMGSSSAA